MIDASNLTRKFGNLTAVNHVSLHIEKGEVFGFLGPNGAGKTTIARMLCCLISKTSGEATIGGYSVSKPDECLEIRKMVGFLPENVGLYDSLSAYQNLDFYGQLYEVPEAKRRDNIERLLRVLGIWDRRDDAVGTFSKGTKQKIAITRALIHDPQVLFLDEPTANLDPEVSKTVREFILDLKKEKRTIILNTHNLNEAERLCDRIAILKGKLVALDSPKNLERSLYSRKTIIHLDKVTEGVLAAVQKLGVSRTIRTVDNKLILEIDKPEMDNPQVVKAVVLAGGNVQYVTELRSTLEDVYLKLIREVSA
jgi:ABC-2 type transport system ATP-binding protein